ncbi:glutathione S-transferase [Immersiella caudata]|uniref:Glutathione S-transferase n=1 Tax=Immersiella caudata TaxID=314043 RepID=A0AA40CDY6_9PEZI|nr:glutathione S-transferase [Immersiella caudata]
MAPFGTIYTMMKPVIHPRTRLAIAISKITSQDITFPPFTFGTDNKSPAYLSKFPLGKIPAFEGTDGFLLTESNAIAQYLADTAPDPTIRAQLLGSTPQERAKVQQWLWFSFQHLEPALNALCLWRYGDGQYGKYDESAEEKAGGDLRRWLGYLEGELEKGGWLAGTKGVSLGDLAICGQLYVGFMLYVDEEMRTREFPGLRGYYERVLEAVPEVREVFDLEGKWVGVRKQPEQKTASGE